MRVDQPGFISLDVLGRGGEGTVRMLADLQLPDVACPLVYKEYNAVRLPEDVAWLTQQRMSVAPHLRVILDAIAVWPVRVVESQGQIVGVVMPQVSDAFYDWLVLPSGKTRKVVREAQNLFIQPDWATRVGRPVPTRDQRLQICRDFATAIEFLHEKMHVVIGDINARSVIYRLDGESTVALLDCDGMRPMGRTSSIRQVNAPDWDPPETGMLAKATDLYKLGLFILRTLTPGSGTSVSRDPAKAADVLDSRGLRLLRNALSGRPDARPSAREWEIYFNHDLGESSLRADRPMSRSFMVVDIEKSSDRINSGQMALRGGLYKLLDVAVRASGWSDGQWVAEDRGDGVMAVVDVPVFDLLGPFLDALLAGLAHRNSQGPLDAWMRLRIAVHHGLVHRDQYGWVGDALTMTFRIGNSEQAKAALKAVDRAQAVIVVSDQVYNDVIRQGYADNQAAYHQLHDGHRASWLRVHGFDTPPAEILERTEER